jgi:uncharacterized cupin superfamily protein
MPRSRPDFIKHVSELPDNGGTVRAGSDEVFSIRTPLSRPLGLVRLGVHHEVLKPGHRTSLPHAETVEEECVYVLEGRPHAWIDGTLYPLRPDDIVVFAPGTGIRHTIVNQTEQDVRLLVVGERAAIGRPRVLKFIHWLKEKHPDLRDPGDLPEPRLLELVDEFEGGGLSARRILKESWRVGLIDHLFTRRSDIEPDEGAPSSGEGVPAAPPDDEPR